LIFWFSPEHLPEAERALYSGDVCKEWVNGTMQILLPALAAIQKRPKNDVLDNPFLLTLWAWDAQFTLGPANETANYSDYQSFNFPPGAPLPAL
jgi:hypothetical protein